MSNRTPLFVADKYNQLTNLFLDKWQRSVVIFLPFYAFLKLATSYIFYALPSPSFFVSSLSNQLIQRGLHAKKIVN